MRVASFQRRRTMQKVTPGGNSDAALYEMVSKGWRDPFNKSKRLTMPAFGGEMSPAQIRAVIGYLKTLWTPEQRQFQSEETRDHPAPSRMP
ncbi:MULTISPECIES: cytochrome c [Rhodopseudomonas]|uniref:c-type cytochrome n=1 Tax=Rhodopseudomonas sp. BAL398 TaxID=3034676 RepID=UPI000ADD8AC2|nr:MULTISPECIES: cytochrome c [Rhodopseudomonas]MDF3812028.1 cytochrome c [Rhodopseudomonas sp. BAL398]